MDKIARKLLASQLGELQIANAELAAENLRLAKDSSNHKDEIARLRADIEKSKVAARLENGAVGPDDNRSALPH